MWNLYNGNSVGYGTVTTIVGHFENLCKELLNPTCLWQASLQKTNDTWNHGKEFEPTASVAREVYVDAMRLKLKRYILAIYISDTYEKQEL